jgi:uncharacterized DUF497 family protein
MHPYSFQFEWDPVKAAANRCKHGVSFELAASVFLDPLALTIPDDAHSVAESRWVTMGKDMYGHDVVVVQPFEECGEDSGRIRIISARRPTRAEITQSEEEA